MKKLLVFIDMGWKVLVGNEVRNGGKFVVRILCMWQNLNGKRGEWEGESERERERDGIKFC